MPEPAVVEHPDDTDTGTAQPDTPETETEAETEVSETPDGDIPEPDIAEVDLGDEDLASSDSLFTGDETSSEDTNSSTQSSDSDSNNSGDEVSDGPTDSEDFFDYEDDGSKPAQIADAINDGAARMAVVGLDDDEKNGLEDELADVFGAFRLGYFASECLHEYVLVEDEPVNPAWGLLGTSLCCAAIALYMRPDSEEQLEKMKQAIENIGGK